MGKIGDLWVKLGIKKEGFDSGLNSAKEKVSGFGKSTGGIVGVFSKIATSAASLWASVGTAAVAAADKFAHTSQRFGDLWDSTTSQMKAAWNVFTSSLTSWNLEGFGSRIKAAMSGAKEAFSASDAEFEVMNSINIRKSQMSKELEILKQRARNQKLSDKEREQAAKEYLDKVKPFYDEEFKLRQQQATAQENQYLGSALGNGSATAGNRKLLERFFTNIANDSDKLNLLAMAGRNGSDQVMAKLAAYYTSTNDKTAKKVADAIVARNYSSSAYWNENQRMTTQMNSLGAAQMSTPKGETEADRIKKQASAIRAAFVPLENINSPLDGLAGAVQQNAADISESLKEVATAFSQQDFLDRHGWEGSMESYVDWLNEMGQVTNQASQEVKNAIVSGFSDSIGTLTDALMGVESVNAGQAFGALVKPIAEACTQIGEMVMMEGLAMIAFKNSINNPYVALAAGAALIAIGQLATSGIEKAVGNVGSSSASSTSGTTSGTSSEYGGEMTIYVKGEIKGDAIAISGQKAINKWNR